MYTLSCLQVAYEFLNREWMYLIYGDQKDACHRTVKSRIGHFYCYVLDLISPKDHNEFISKENCKYLIIVIVTSLGVIFTAYKVMKILLSSEVKKSIMESQWRRDENSNKMCPAFHENNNESAQITEDFPWGTSLTAIVKPTIRSGNTCRSVDPKYDHESSDNESCSEFDLNGLPNNTINVMNFAGHFDFIKPLVKGSLSLRVMTSKDSLNEEFRNNYKPQTGHLKAENEENVKGMNIPNKLNNLTFPIEDSSSVFEADDCVSSVLEDTISPYQCSINAHMSPDTPSVRKNSSYVSGHFVESFPDLDLSPILNVSPKNKKYQQSEINDKEIVETKDAGKKSDTEIRKNISNSLTQGSKCLEKSPDPLFSCWDFKSLLSGKLSPNKKSSKIPKLNLSAGHEEDGLNLSKSNAPDAPGSKIPILLRKSQTTNIATEGELNDLFKLTEPTESEKNKDLRSRQSELSLQRFIQLEIATGCYSSSNNNHQSFVSQT